MAGRVQDKLVDGAYGLGWAGVKRLPEPAAVALGRRIADFAWKRRGKSVLRLESNLARVVPDAGPERLRELSRAGMRSYMRYWMESFRLPTMDPERFGTDVDGTIPDRGLFGVFLAGADPKKGGGRVGEPRARGG
ncbi:LpxL/LpxP family acyltransferase, partial [Streptomyces sp. NPDC001193]